MPFSIPEEHYPYFRAVAALSDEQRSAILEVLGSVRPASSFSDIREELLERLPLERTVAEQVLTIVFSLYRVREHYQLTTKDTVHEIVSSIPAMPGDQESFVAFLERILSYDATLGIAARATEILTAHPHPFGSARIFTDVRPIFAPESESEIAACVVIHNLRVSTASASDESSDYFFALDSRDLRDLQKVVSRAIAKEDAVRALSTKTSIPFVS